jgi:hypothetical protein
MHLRRSAATIAFMAKQSSAGHRAGDSLVADPVAPVVPELAIAFGDCDRAPMPAPSALSRERTGARDAESSPLGLSLHACG